MSTQDFSPRLLNDKEQETFRRDFQDKEREIQRYIGVYLSGLVIVTGWVIGPQSRPILAMVLGNDGYNVYAFLIFLVLNIVFTNFLIYKSLIIHEITQFMTVLAKPNSSFLYWDSWRRSKESATKPVRYIYSASLSILPVCVSFLMIYGVWNVLYSDPAALLNRLVELDRPAVVQQTTESQKITVNDASTYSHLTTTKLEQVLRRARIWFWIVVVLHIIPLYFIYINGVPTLRRWNSIHQLKRSDLLFDDLSNHSAPKEGLPKSIQLYDKATGRMLGPITSQQLEFLIEQLEEEHAGDRDYYLQRDMLDTLERQGADPKLMHLLRAAMRKSGEIEIEWRDESQKGTNDE